MNFKTLLILVCLTISNPALDLLSGQNTELCNQANYTTERQYNPPVVNDAGSRFSQPTRK
ncbi:MAG: hypothetical protein SWJ54_10285 [Cyanobacteriota bacterium]|nr:hypothetical protein [Cyanobacteriota bacterium]